MHRFVVRLLPAQVLQDTLRESHGPGRPSQTDYLKNVEESNHQTFVMLAEPVARHSIGRQQLSGGNTQEAFPDRVLLRTGNPAVYPVVKLVQGIERRGESIQQACVKTSTRARLLTTSRNRLGKDMVTRDFQVADDLTNPREVGKEADNIL